jgi:SAM-dependent methyltransferase
VRAGSAEDLPVDDAEFDAVLGAQMWHWVRLAPAVTEVARVLRRGGSFGLLWNLRDERVRWIGELGRILGGEDTHSGAAHVVLPAGSPFTATAARDFPWSHELAPGDIVDLVATRSHVQVQSESDRAELLSRVTELVATHPDTAGKARVVVRYVCSCWRATRI